MISWKNKQLKDIDAKKLKRSVPAYFILGLAVAAMTFFGVCTPAGQQIVSPSGIAASVGNSDIPAIEFRRAHINQTQQYQQQYGDKFDPVAMGLSRSVVDGLINQYAVYGAAFENGFYATEDEIAKLIIEGEYFRDDKGKFSTETFNRFLRNQMYTEKSFSDELKRSIVSNKLRSFVTSTYDISAKQAELEYKVAETKLDIAFLKVDDSAVEIEVTKEEQKLFADAKANKPRIESYFKRNASEFNRDKQVKARHILIGFKGAKRASGDAANRSKADAKKKAQSVLAEVKRKRAGFDSLATKYTDEPGGKAKGGDLGFFKRSTMVKEFSDVAFAMKKGQVSGLVESPFGFHIIKVEDIKEGVKTNLDQAKLEIARRLIVEQKRPKILGEIATKAHELAKKGDALGLSKLGLKWKKTGNFALNAKLIPGGLGNDDQVLAAVYSLKKKGELYKQPLNVRGAYFIVKLANRVDADMSKFTDETLEENRKASRPLQAFWLHNQMVQSIVEKFDEQGLVYRNPEFMNYDERVKELTGGNS